MVEIDLAEHLAVVLTRVGLQRLTARLLAAFLFTEAPTLTMGELVEQLGVSSGSASTGVRTLVTVGLVEQVPVPGSRRDHYRMREDAWVTLFTNQNEAVRVMREAADAGIAAAAPDSLARQRLEAMRGFYDFVLAEIPSLVARWKRVSACDNARSVPEHEPKQPKQPRRR